MIDILIYMISIMLARYCINKAISMTFKTNKVIVYSYLVFFGGVSGIALWTAFYGGNFPILVIITGMAMILYGDKRLASRSKMQNTAGRNVQTR